MRVFGQQSFYDVLTEAVRDMADHGYDSIARLEMWVERIRTAAKASLVPDHVLKDALNSTLATSYRRLIDQGGIAKIHQGVSRFTIDRLKPRLRGELERRVLSSAQLIKLNREAAIEKTVQRFSGWASSIPPGGSDAVDKPEVKANIRKSLAQLPFEERRVVIDQGHKFMSELSAIVAQDGNAIAARWHSHWRQRGYNYRVDHKERDEHYYAVRGNWAIEDGLMTKGAGYTDEITKPAEEPFCRCNYVWIYNLRDLPADMVTVKGQRSLAHARERMRAVA